MFCTSVQMETPSSAFTKPEPLMVQSTSVDEKRAMPLATVSTPGCSVKATCPDVTRAPELSLIVPVIEVVVWAKQETEANKHTKASMRERRMNGSSRVDYLVIGETRAIALMRVLTENCWRYEIRYFADFYCCRLHGKR